MLFRSDSEFTQLKGRIWRQGSNFREVEIVIPQVWISLETGLHWSWDEQRLEILKGKRTLADCAVDGSIPDCIAPAESTLRDRALSALSDWKNQILGGLGQGGPDLTEDIRDYSSAVGGSQFLGTDMTRSWEKFESEISEFNRLGKITKSTTMHTKLQADPRQWHRYHELRDKSIESWPENPVSHIAKLITDDRWIVADFGCGTAALRDALPGNKVYSFDHVAIDPGVIACNMKNVPLEEYSVDTVVFSLSLWGTDWLDYIIEAARVLGKRGFMYIAEPSSSEKGKDFIELVESCGFKIFGEPETRYSKFTYWTFIRV